MAVTLVLAGCMGGAGPAGTSGTDPPKPTFDADTGAIEGTVTNDERMPVAAAALAVRGAVSRDTTTDASGRFAFGNLPPGEYDLLVAALGYEEFARKATVALGEVTAIDVTLNPIPISGVPYKRLHGPLTGKFFCGFSALVSGPCKVIGLSDSNHPVEQQWRSVSGGEGNIFEFRDIHKKNRSNPDDEFSAAVVEITWRSGSAGSQWLQSTIEDLPATAGARDLSEPDWNRTVGISPLRMTLTPGMKSYDGKWTVPDEIKGFLVGVFPSPDPSNPKTPPDLPCPSPAPTCLGNRTLGASAYMEQKFEVWISLFYNGKPDSAFTAVRDA